MQKTINLWLILLMIIGFGSACELLLDQTDEANKFVDEANVIIKKYNDDTLKSEKLFKELLGEDLMTVGNFEVYKKENKEKFDELLSLSEQMEKSALEVSGKFEQAAKLKVDPKYKEYLEVKLQEFAKRIAAEKLTAPFIKSFLEAKEVKKIDEIIEDFNKKAVDLNKEATALESKADQIVKENPNKIK